MQTIKRFVAGTVIVSVIFGCAACTSGDPVVTTSAVPETAASQTTETEATTVASSESPDATEIEIISFDPGQQEYANIIVSNFAEQFITDFDWQDASVAQLLDFVHMFLKINSSDSISYETKGEVTYETFSFEEAHDVVIKHIGIFMSDVGLEGLQAPPDSHGDHASGPYYEDAKIWYEAADGESHNLVAIVDSAINNFDGTITLKFTIYAIDMDTYSQIDSDGLREYYRLTGDQAASDTTLAKVISGTAVVNVGQNGEYYMLSYHTDK